MAPIRGTFEDRWPAAHTAAAIVYRDNGTTATAELADDGTIGRLVVERDENAPPLSSRFLRSLPLSAIEQRARALRAEVRKYAESSAMSVFDDESGQWVDTPVVHATPAHRLAFTNPARLRACALYADLADEPNVYVVIAERLHCSEQHAKNLVSKGRTEDGYLTPTKKGRRGGELTDKARAIMRAEKEEAAKALAVWESRPEDAKQYAIDANAELAALLAAGDFDGWKKRAAELYQFDEGDD